MLKKRDKFKWEYIGIHLYKGKVLLKEQRTVINKNVILVLWQSGKL